MQRKRLNTWGGRDRDDEHDAIDSLERTSSPVPASPNNSRPVFTSKQSRMFSDLDDGEEGCDHASPKLKTKSTGSAKGSTERRPEPVQVPAQSESFSLDRSVELDPPVKATELVSDTFLSSEATTTMMSGPSPVSERVASPADGPKKKAKPLPLIPPKRTPVLPNEAFVSVPSPPDSARRKSNAKLAETNDALASSLLALATTPSPRPQESEQESTQGHEAPEPKSASPNNILSPNINAVEPDAFAAIEDWLAGEEAVFKAKLEQ